MQLTDIIFYFFALITVVSAGVVVFSRNVIHSAFSLLFTFFGVAGLYVLLSADFLAVTQLLIYVGGILVLLLFGVMLTNRVVDVEIKTGTLQTIPAAILTSMLAGTLCGLFWMTDWRVVLSEPQLKSTAPGMGEIFMTSYLLPFEVSSVVLLVAMLGAAMIARREKPTTK
jgi:NADH-quinone oxidoreductase subunit J